MFCCSAWADRASARRSLARLSARSPATRSCTCSTRPTRRKSAISKAASISRARSSSCRANPAARSSPTSSRITFYERAKQAVGAAEAAKRFVAITDPGSSLEKMALTEGFRHVFHGEPSIGGRYSVLSHFGMVPAAAIGIDLRAFLDSTAEMVRSCAASAPPVENPGVILGAILGCGQRSGRDKVTIIASKGIADFGAWLEQLLAESTGKLGKGIVPVDAEPLGAAGRLWQRPGVRLSAARLRPGRRTGAGGRRAGSGRAAGGADHRFRCDAARAGILPLGDGDRCRRLDHRHQPVRPARCRGGQGQGARPYRRL